MFARVQIIAALAVATAAAMDPIEAKAAAYASLAQRLQDESSSHLEVEEKFEKYFGYLARCDAKFLDIDPSKSKFWVKI